MASSVERFTESSLLHKARSINGEGRLNSSLAAQGFRTDSACVASQQRTPEKREKSFLKWLIEIESEQSRNHGCLTTLQSQFRVTPIDG